MKPKIFYLYDGSDKAYYLDRQDEPVPNEKIKLNGKTFCVVTVYPKTLDDGDTIHIVVAHTETNN